MVKEGYDEMEKEALKAWNVDMLTDIFPQKEEFSKDIPAPAVLLQYKMLFLSFQFPYTAFS